MVMTTLGYNCLRRDYRERPNPDWLVGYYRWFLTHPCASCGKDTEDTVSGTRDEVLRMIAEGCWLCQRCESN